MQHAYVEFLGSHVVITSLATSVILAFAFGLIGPIGFYTVASGMGRIALSFLFVALCFPVYFGCVAVMFHFMRFRSPLAILAALTLITPLVSFHCTAVIYSIETMAHTGVPAEAGFGEVLFQVIAASLVAVYLGFYVVWQRTRNARRAAGSSAAGRDAPPAGRDANDTAAPTGGEHAAGKPAANPADAPAAAASEGRSPDLQERDKPANARMRSNGGPPDSRPLQGGPAAPLTAQPGTGATSATASGGNLLKLLPGRLGTDLVFVKSEDHYLEVHTTAGSSLIKMRFSDAVAELGDRGVQVHRSYWVATRHVVRTARNGKRTMLRLTGDHEVPVSVTHLRTVRALLDR